MADICGDNRFELIEKCKQKLLDATNISDSPEEMAVIDNILFRFWQMGWLKGELFGKTEQLESSLCGHEKDHVADPGNMVGDSISRAAAIEAIKEDKIDLTDPNVVAAFKATGDFEKVETQVMTCDRHIKILKVLPSAQPTMGQVNQGDTVNERAVKFLDLFAKTYCRDKSVADDLKFRCSECKFEMPDKKCLVKCMAQKLCPNYKDFGSMGDL